MPRLTDTRIRSLKPTGKRYIVWDANGLGVRVGTSGKRSFVYTYREGPKVRWMTLGNYPTLSLAEAREKHGKALAAREKGLSPADAELDAKHEAQKAPTVAQLADYYVEHYAKRQKKSWQEDERQLRKDVLPHLGHLKARAVRRRDIIDLVECIADRGAPVTANRTLAVISRMFNFAVEREILEATPARWWTIPPARTKNGLAHRVPLSDLALNLLGRVKTLSGDSAYLFPSPRGNGPITVRALTRAVDRNIKALGVADFTPHDLRRTVASHMAGFGIPRLVISKILNHVEPGITAIYDRHSYDPEKRDALARWAERLGGLVNSADSEME
jgi:integrase